VSIHNEFSERYLPIGDLIQDGNPVPVWGRNSRECPGARDTRTGVPSEWKPMVISNPIEKEVGGSRVIEAIKQLSLTFQRDCVGCGTSFRDADTVIGYAVQSAAEPVPDLVHVTCAECGPIPERRFTIGVREVIVRGHAGTIVNTRAQATRQVLLEPDVELVSPAHTNDPYPPDPSVWPSGSIAELFGTDVDAVSQHTPPVYVRRQRTDGGGRRDNSGDGGDRRNISGGDRNKTDGTRSRPSDQGHPNQRTDGEDTNTRTQISTRVTGGDST